MQITNRYDDIISLPHHQSKTRPHMPLIDRAAQFSPFAALTGYDDAVKETARKTERKAKPSLRRPCGQRDSKADGTKGRTFRRNAGMSAGKATDFTGADPDETESDTDLF